MRPQPKLLIYKITGLLSRRVKKHELMKYIVVGLMAIVSIFLIALELKTIGWLLLGLTAILLVFTDRYFAKHAALVLFALAILGVMSIDTDISLIPASVMALLLTVAVIVPYIFTTYIYKDRAIRFSWHHGRSWYKIEIFYIALTAVIAYFLLPFYFASTGAYLNWPAPQNLDETVRLFIGTNALGIWDELFFVGVVLGILKKHVGFWFANFVQATIWTAFLYELGFISWIFAVIFLFALLQGYIFKKTDSFLYIITIHLTLDLVLFLALLNAHESLVIPLFIA